MSAETELYAVLAASSGLAALVADRIYPDAIPEDKALPAVVYSRTATDPVLTIHGTKVAETAALSITAWSQTRTESEAVADAVAIALLGAGQPFTNRSSGFDGEVGLYGVTVETEWFTT